MLQLEVQVWVLPVQSIQHVFAIAQQRRLVYVARHMLVALLPLPVVSNMRSPHESDLRHMWQQTAARNSA